MSVIVIEGNNITIDGKILETVKSVGLTPTVKAIPVLITEERMYPPLRNITSQNHQITGEAYGNGNYIISYSSTYGGAYEPYECFNSSDIVGGHWAANRYNSSSKTFNHGDNIVPDYLGEWLKIKLPVAINLTKYAFKTRSSSYLSRAPGDFKIYGSNDEIEWVELTHITTPTYVSGLYETTISTSGTYNIFALVVNKLYGGHDVLNFDEWYIYGMEKLDQNNYSIVPFHEPINDDYKYIPFVNTGANQTSYNIHFSENTECDILVVGGGGGGGHNGGGGGGGDVLYFIGVQVQSGTYDVRVGKGGTGVHATNSGATTDGIKSEFYNITAAGGGKGHAYSYTTPTNAPEENYINPLTGISSISVGALGGIRKSFSASKGGDGAGGLALEVTSENAGTNGGDGIQNSITGTLLGYGGGGGGRDVSHPETQGRGTDGGADARTGNASIEGRGGGGASEYNNGGSGIVIIRYKIIKENYNAQWTYNPSNLNVYHLGNVGIGTINPTSALDVVGSVVVNGGISTKSYIANTKTFKIEHPLNMNKLLYHGCIEGPRFDNIYRGKKTVINGTCEVDIDNECNTTGGMTSGTFMALNNNFSLHLQNKKSFDGVKGEIIDGKIIINCENITDEIEIDWLVIGERQDDVIIKNKLTNTMGSLICEHDVNRHF